MSLHSQPDPQCCPGRPVALGSATPRPRCPGRCLPTTPPGELPTCRSNPTRPDLARLWALTSQPLELWGCARGHPFHPARSTWGSQPTSAPGGGPGPKIFSPLFCSHAEAASPWAAPAPTCGGRTPQALVLLALQSDKDSLGSDTRQAQGFPSKACGGGPPCRPQKADLQECSGNEGH